MILAFHKLLALAADETTDIADTLVDAHNLLDRFEGECGTIDHLRDMDTLMDDTLQQVDARQASGINGITGIPTGLADLDRLTSGWQRGDLNVIAARPAVGKTAFALHLARAAATAGHHVAVYSLEMQGERLGDRWLVAASPDVNARHLRGGAGEESRYGLACTAYPRGRPSGDEHGQGALFGAYAAKQRQVRHDYSGLSATLRHEVRPEEPQPRTRGGADHPQGETHGKRTECARSAPEPVEPGKRRTAFQPSYLERPA